MAISIAALILSAWLLVNSTLNEAIAAVIGAVVVIWEGSKALFAIPRYKLPHLYEILADFFREGAGGERWFTIMAQNAAINHGAIVAVFSLEMSRESLLRRMLASQAWVDQTNLQKGFISGEEQSKLRHALNQLLDRACIWGSQKHPCATAWHTRKLSRSLFSPSSQ